ncbi:MAG: UvrB/UvrC motif-containing protein [Clostridia bacterium]|nr:UvrB/UvrC motif-containing protein [Clostridia bacterium]
MKCDNCGKNNANVRYLRNINGVKQEMNLCEECSRKLGITDIGFNMPIDFSSFLGGFFEDFENSDLMQLVEPRTKLKCKGCNYTFEDIINTGKFGCPECYETFETEIDSLLNKLHGSNRHKGRLGKLEKAKVEEENKSADSPKKDKKSNEQNKLEQLKNKLKQLVKEEKYEEAAKVRDEIKELEK